jgi:hypothetical protein
MRHAVRNSAGEKIHIPALDVTGVGHSHKLVVREQRLCNLARSTRSGWPALKFLAMSALSCVVSKR